MAARASSAARASGRGPCTASAAPSGAIVARVKGERRDELSAYLDVAATCLSPLLERERLLQRSAAGERALLGNSEARLTRLGFDLHDGPVQDVLILGQETRTLRDQIYPFVLESHRELAYGRFEDLIARVVELDRALRDAAHSLETRSVVSRPLAEILHREVESFRARRHRGDPDDPGRPRDSRPATARRRFSCYPGVAFERQRAQWRDDG